MEDVISKELLSEVLFNGRVRIKSIGINDNTLDYSMNCSLNEKDGTDYNKHIEDNYYVVKRDIYEDINIYELAHKCKVWAYEQRYLVESSVMGVAIISRDTGIRDNLLLQRDRKVMYDPLLDIKACQWILDNKYRHETK